VRSAIYRSIINAGKSVKLDINFEHPPFG